MICSQEEFLFLFGWDDFYQSQSLSPVSSSFILGRVICEERNLYSVQVGIDRVLFASVSGKLQFDSHSRLEYPAVGDWVWLSLALDSDRGVIHEVLLRKTILHRKQIGSSSDMQILATNVNIAFITSSMNEDLNIQRIYRYLTVVQDAGCLPVILLTKADLYHESIDEFTSSVKDEFRGTAVHAVSKEGFSKSACFESYLKKGTTSVFLGSSGVGKSTLINYLVGSEIAHVHEIRDSDGKGRHTTTSRNLYLSRFGGLVIDTPGMRELQLSDHLGGVQSQFSEIGELTKSCRFNDCQHLTEPECSIKSALLSGDLSEERWRSYQKLDAESRFFKRKNDKVFLSEERRIWKKRSQDSRNRRRFGKRDFN